MMGMTDRTATVHHNGRDWTVELRFGDFGRWAVLVTPKRLPTDGPGPLPPGQMIGGTSTRDIDPVFVFERQVAHYGGVAA